MTVDYLKNHREWAARQLAEAKKTLSHTSAFASLDMFDEDAFADAIVKASEAERVGAASALRTVMNLTLRNERSDLRGRAVVVRTDLLLEFGTATPTSRSWVSISTYGAYGPSAVPERLREVFESRPAPIRDRIIRWFWEKPRDRVVAWEAWRSLIRQGVVEERYLDTYYLGALSSLAPPWQAEPEDLDAVREEVNDWVRADPQLVELARKGYRLPAAHENESSYLTFGRLRLIETGVLTPDDIFDVGFAVLSDAPNRNASAQHRTLIDAAAADIALLASREGMLLRVLTHGQPAEQAWALDKVVALSDAGVPCAPARVVPGLIATANAGSGSAVRGALAYAKAHVTDGERIDVALAALAHSKSTQQQHGFRALSEFTPSDLTGQQRAELDVVAPGLAPAVRTKVLDWLGESTSPPPRAAADSPPQFVPPVPADMLPLPDADAVVGLVAALIAAPGDPVDLERALDGLARFRASQASAAVRMDALTALQRAADPAVGTPLCHHLFDAFAAWLSDQAPANTDALHASKRPWGSRIQYRQPELALPGFMMGNKSPGWQSLTCEMSGTNGLTCARAWEAASISAREPGPLLALPTQSTGGIAPEAFATRVSQGATSAADLRYDAIGALLRLPLQCDDADVIATLRSSRYPVASAALALWGHAALSDVADWLRPAVSSRSIVVTGAHADMRSVTWEGHLSAQTWPSLVIEWAGEVPPVPSLTDPVGSIAWLAGSDGVAVRQCDWWSGGSLPLAGLTRGESWRRSMMAAPAHADALLAAFAAVVVRLGQEDRTSIADDAPLLYLLEAPVSVGRGAHLYLATAMVGKSSSARSVAVDLLVAQPGRWDAAELGRAIAMLIGGGLKGLGRAAALAATACTGSEAARLIAGTCSATVSAMSEAHRELGAWLETWELACDAADMGVEDPAARHALTQLAVGSSKRAASARRLLAIETS